MLVDHDLSGVIVGLTLATRPPDIYRALLEATAFGTRVIIDAFDAAGVPVDRAGRRRRSDARTRLLMQIYADVTRLPLSLIGSEQGPALGSAIHAAVAAGAYPDVPAAAAAMGRDRRGAYLPDPDRAAMPTTTSTPSTATLHDYFGRGGNDVLHRLRAIRERAARQHAGGRR